MSGLETQYLKHQVITSALSISLLIPVSIAFAFFLGSNAPLYIAFGYTVILFMYLFMTKYRIKRGYFGSTSGEAEELLSFASSIARNEIRGNS
jgi:hypothetical protein